MKLRARPIGSLSLGFAVLLAGALGLLENGLRSSRAWAQPAPPATSAVAAPFGNDEVVARVGSDAITLGQLNQRLHAAPAFMLRRYGSTADEIKRTFLDQVLSREIVLSQGAVDRGFDKRLEVAERVRGILRNALLERIKKDDEAVEISDADVKAYYEANKDKFTAPHRLSLWRILVASEDEARGILADMKKDAPPDIKKWSQIARDKSLDKASAMQSGNIGTLNPDGTTRQPELEYDPVLFQAADKVKDGEIVGEPVKEGDKWAVVWRKQGMRAVSRSVDAEASTIRATILDERIRKDIATLLQKLRADNVAEIHPELCEMITVADTGEIERAKRPGVLPRPRRLIDPNVTDTPAGLR